MSWFDRFTENSIRKVAQGSSRRGFLRGLGAALVGGAASAPLLPVAHADNHSPKPKEEGDPTQCEYWRYCATDGFLCTCCGGTYNSCPPGTEMSPITWIGTCQNPTDGRNYIISYNDCCGKGPCGSCLCIRDEGDRPIYRSDKTNDYNWCLGTKSAVYHCSVARVVGLAIEE